MNRFFAFFLPNLNIGVPRGPEEVGDAGPAHRGGHGLAGGLDAGQQLGEVTWTQQRKLILLGRK